MSPAPDLSQSLESRVIRLEERFESFRRDAKRADDEREDHESRIRALESAQMRLAGKISVLAVAGSAIATAAVQFIFRGLQ